MKNREEYIDKLAAQLKEWSAKIDELETKARTAKENAKIEYETHVSELKKKRDTATHKLQELKNSSSEAWEVMKAGTEAAWVELKKAMTDAKEKFKKP
jgi:uncharacterized coiled-coil DUF342 family protein